MMIFGNDVAFHLLLHPITTNTPERSQSLEPVSYSCVVLSLACPTITAISLSSLPSRAHLVTNERLKEWKRLPSSYAFGCFRSNSLPKYTATVAREDTLS